MKTINIFFICCALVLLNSCSQTSNDYIEISKNDYKNQLHGFWLGQCIANWTGLITEMDKIGFDTANTSSEFYTSEKYHKIGLLPPYTAGDTYGNISGTGYNRGIDLIISIYSGGHGPFDSSGLSVDNKLIWTNGPNGTTLSDFINLPDYTFIDNIFIDSNVNNHIKIEQLDNRMDDTLGYSVGQTNKNANYNSIHLDSFMVKCKVKIKDYKTNSSIFYIGENNIDAPKIVYFFNLVIMCII